MKTKTIIMMTQKIDSMVVSINDFLPSHDMEDLISYYERTTNVFGALMFELVMYYLIHNVLRYDRAELKRSMSGFQWKMFSSMELRYMKIVLFSEPKFKNTSTKEIANKAMRMYRN